MDTLHMRKKLHATETQDLPAHQPVYLVVCFFCLSLSHFSPVWSVPSIQPIRPSAYPPPPPSSSSSVVVAVAVIVCIPSASAHSRQRHREHRGFGSGGW